MSVLKTGYKVVAKSGHTIDGRIIPAEALISAAKNFNKDEYQPKVFPGHYIAYLPVYGFVEDVTYTKNDRGEVIFYADMSPNSYWVYDGKNDQFLYTSVGLRDGFKGKEGNWVLDHIACCNDPASLGIEKLEFSKVDNSLLLSTAYKTDISVLQFNTQENKAESKIESLFYSVFSKLLKDDKTMNDAEKNQFKNELKTEILAAFKTELPSLLQQFSKTEPTPPNDGKSSSEEFIALKQENDALKTKFSALENKQAGNEEKLTEFETKFSALETKVTNALKEVPGTDGGNDFTAGDSDSLKYNV